MTETFSIDQDRYNHTAGLFLRGVHKSFTSLETAIRSARYYARECGNPVSITRSVTTPHPRKLGGPKLVVEHIATVSKDALGRVWTDLTHEGAKLL